MSADQIATAMAFVKEHKPKAMMVVEERATYYPPVIFDRFWWPHTKELVDALWSEHVVTFMHLDTDWGRYLPYWKQLPRGSYVLQLDSTTDIVAAKELLRGHAMFDGDVPAALQALGDAEDVEGYVKNLIDKVGYEGGFFLGTGCEVPLDCRFENLKAMVDTGKTYGLVKR